MGITVRSVCFCRSLGPTRALWLLTCWPSVWPPLRLESLAHPVSLALSLAPALALVETRHHRVCSALSLCSSACALVLVWVFESVCCLRDKWLSCVFVFAIGIIPHHLQLNQWIPEGPTSMKQNGGVGPLWYSPIQLEQHSVEHILPPGWAVYVLNPTDRLDLHPDLNQNLIVLFLSPTQLIDLVLS